MKLLVIITIIGLSWSLSALAAGTPITFPPNTTFLVEPSTAAAQSRSQTQCQALGCDGTLTVYWWQAQPLTDGTAALVIAPSGPFSATTTNKVAKTPTGLTPTEQSALVPYSTILPVLPTVTTPAVAVPQ